MEGAGVREGGEESGGVEGEVWSVEGGRVGEAGAVVEV